LGESLRQLGDQVQTLRREVAELRRRVATLEGRALEGPSAPAPVVSQPTAAAAVVAPEVRPDSSLLALVGRTLVVLGGAYLLRAISDSGTIPDSVGVGAGLLYATWWLVAAYRASAADETGAAFHGFASSIIAFPLLYEATARFGVLSTPVGAAALLAPFTGGLFVARRRDLPAIGWTFTLSAAAAALALLLATQDLVPIIASLLGAGLVLEVFGKGERWRALRWPIALVLDLVGVVLAVVVARSGGPPTGYPVIPTSLAVTLELLVPILYVSTVAARTLLRQRPLTPFEMVQCGLSLLIGLGGARMILASTGGSTASLALAILGLGVACYLVAFSWIDRRSGRGKNFYYYTTLGLLLVLAAGGGLLSNRILASVWLGLALVACGAGHRYDRTTLSFQGVIYWLAGALLAGLPGAAIRGLTAPGPLPRPPPVALLAVAVGAFTYAWLLPRPGAGKQSWPLFTLRGLAAWGTAWGAAGLAVLLLASPLPRLSSDPGILATTRTLGLAGLATALAIVSRRWSLADLRWLVYATLALGGLKLLVEDLPRGRPATLFVSLGAFGSALALVPRLLPKRTTPSARPVSAGTGQSPT